MSFRLLPLLLLLGSALGAQSRVFVDGDFVVFVYVNPECQQAYVGGNFNGWTFEQSPMVKQPDGTWFYKLNASGYSEILFKFAHELEWDQDSYLAAPDFREDGFGGKNGYLSLTSGPATQPPAPPPNSFPEPGSMWGREVNDFFLPGISVSMAQPFEGGKLYSGLNFHYTLLTGIVRGDRDEFGGYYAVYAEIGYYKEWNSAPNDDIFFLTNLGITLSFEKMYDGPRNFFIPYFGARLGSIVFQGSSPGFLSEPLLGIVVFYLEPAILKYDASLLLSSVNLNTTIGIRHSLALSVNF